MDAQRVEYFTRSYEKMDDEQLQALRSRSHELCEEAVEALNTLSDSEHKVSFREDGTPDLSEDEIKQETAKSQALYTGKLASSAQSFAAIAPLGFIVSLLGPSGLKAGALIILAVGFPVLAVARVVAKKHIKTTCSRIDMSIEQKEKALRSMKSKSIVYFFALTALGGFLALAIR